MYRTTDGGKTWQRVLFVDPDTGCSGLTMDAHDPNVLFAGMWQVEMHTWAMFSGGPSSGIYVITRRRHDLDAGRQPRTSQVAARQDRRRHRARRFEARVRADSDRRPGLALALRRWRRHVAGRELVASADRARRILHPARCQPANADEILIANSSFFRSTDGGRTFDEVPWGGDNHDIWIDPQQPARMGLTNDAGARLTTDHGKTWTNIQIANGQMYHVAVDNQVPYWIYTNRQDNGTMRGPSTAPEAVPGARRGPPPTAAVRGAGADSARIRGDSSRTARSSQRRQANAPADSASQTDSLTRNSANRAQSFQPRGSTWDHGLGGCESGFTLPDPTNPDIVWASCYGNEVTRWNARTKRARSVSPWIHTLDSPPNETKYRCHWTPPLAIDPFDHNTVYYGCQVVFKTSNAGQSWTVISPDLSTRDSSRIVSSGGIVADNLGQFYGEVVFAIAPSEIRKGLIWAGTNDGKLWYTRDGGATWTDVTQNMTGLPAWGTIRKIEPSHFDPATAYVAVDFHMMDNRKPYIYKTTDLRAKLDQHHRGSAGRRSARLRDGGDGEPEQAGNAVRRDGPRLLLLARRRRALDAVFNDGLPAVPVTWIVVPKLWHDVVVSTYGRGIYILRDIAPLEQNAGSTAAKTVTLYRPHPGYRQARSGNADITFSTPAKTARPVTLEILDSTGTTIRTMRVATRAGYNRVSWDLRYDAPERVDLRTTPAANPHIWEEPRFKGKKVRPITHWGIQGPETAGPIATPGHYSVRLVSDGTPPQVQPLTILRNADISSSDADLAASTRMQIRIRNDMDSAVSMINSIEKMRLQVDDQRRSAASDADALLALNALDNKMLAVELQLLSRSDLNSDDKYYVEQYRVYLNLIWLSGEVGSGAGDVAGGADFRPTDTSHEVLAGIERQLSAAHADFNTLVQRDVPAFNKSAGGRLRAIAIE